MSDAVDFELNIDVSSDEIREWGGESGPPLPPGVYDFQLTEVEQGVSGTGGPVLKITFEVLNEGSELGKTMKRSYSLQKQSLPRLKNLMMAAGARLDAVRRSDLLDRHIVAEVVHKMGDPQPQADGSIKEGRMMGDIINERAPEGAEQAAAPEPEPAKKPEPKAETKPAATTAGNAKATTVRRAIGQARQ